MIHDFISPPSRLQHNGDGEVGCVACKRCHLETSFAKFKLNLKTIRAEHCSRHETTSAHCEAIRALVGAGNDADVIVGVPSVEELQEVLVVGKPSEDKARRSKIDALTFCLGEALLEHLRGHQETPKT